MQCVLCGSPDCKLVMVHALRRLFRCESCQLVFVCPDDRVTIEAERERYALHDNTFDNPGYVAYLTAIASEIGIEPGKPLRILDFGSGPQFVLTRLLRERGCVCDPYDPLYALDIVPVTSDTAYDLVVLCESIEHIRNLPEALNLIMGSTALQGRIFIKTQLYDISTDFSRWWYVQDSTHINFFNAHTLQTLGEMLNRRIVSCDNKNTVVLGV